MITKRLKYAFKALLYITASNTEKPVQASEIAEVEKIPVKFLEQILLDLKTRGILRSWKGKHGGYTLARPAGEIRLIDVIRVLEGPVAPLPCLSETAYAPCNDCADEQRCGVRRLFVGTYKSMLREMESTSLLDAIPDSIRSR